MADGLRFPFFACIDRGVNFFSANTRRGTPFLLTSLSSQQDPSNAIINYPLSAPILFVFFLDSAYVQSILKN